MGALAPDYVTGLNEIERTINALPFIVFLVVWGLFLAGLRTEGRGRRRFHAVLAVHFLPLPAAFFGNQREFWQFLAWGALGGVALIIGLPHHFWERGKRARPRIITAVCVVLAFELMVIVGLAVRRS